MHAFRPAAAALGAAAGLSAAPLAGAAAQTPPAPPAATNSTARATTPADTAPVIRFGGFVDGYYAYDVGRPPSRDRSFAGGALFGTQPARHNEFNVNLAFVDATLTSDRYRGRLALQFGTSVQANYIGEPRQGQISGPGVQQYLQEAVAGYRLGRGLWVDGGIFFSNMGMESWISRDNPTYTRSLVADYSPYYSTGVKLTYAASPKLTARLDLVNGWQNISENNPGKGAGLRLDYAATPAATFSYYNFFSEEAGTRLRTFNGLGFKRTEGALTLVGEGDICTQRRAPGTDGSSTWYGLLFAARAQVSPRVALVGRVERYDDKDQVILATGATGTSATGTSATGTGATGTGATGTGATGTGATGTGATGTGAGAVANPAFRGNGASLGLDVAPVPGSARVLWRIEARGFRNRDAVFPDGPDGPPSRNGGFVVTSLALTF